MPKDIEETNSGVKKSGSWKEVAEFGEEVKEALEGSEMDDSSVEEFEDWRPKREEAENDMKKKTVEEALLQKQRMEEETEGVRKDLRTATEEVANAGKKAARKEAPEKEFIEASEKAARPFLSTVLKSFRKFEQLVYSTIILRGKRYYLDTEDFSVDMKSNRGNYEMDVNVPEENPRRDLKETLEDN